MSQRNLEANMRGIFIKPNILKYQKFKYLFIGGGIRLPMALYSEEIIVRFKNEFYGEYSEKINRPWKPDAGVEGIAKSGIYLYLNCH